MKNFIVFLMILFWIKGFTVTLYGQKYFQIHADSPNVPDDNVTLLGMWTSGSCNGVFVEGNYAYIIKRATIEILDITDPKAPIPLGHLALDEHIYQILVAGNYAYIMREYYDGFGQGLSGFYIIDIQDPTNPVENGFYELNESGWYNGRWIDVYSDKLFLIKQRYENGLWYSKMNILDIKDSYNIKEIGRSDVFEDEWSALQVIDNYAYIGSAIGFLSCPLYRFDICNPENPILIGKYSTEGKVVSVSEKYTYLFGSNQLQVIEIIDSLEYKLLGSYDFGDFRRVDDVHIADDYAYISSTSFDTSGTGSFLSLAILDIADPANLVKTGSFNKAIRGGSVEKMFVYQDYAYMAVGPEGLSIIDLSDAYNPKEIQSYHTGGGVGSFTVDGNYTFVDNGQFGGLSIIDSGDPENLQMINFFETNITESQMIVSGNNLFLIGASLDWSTGYLSVIDITNPNMPQQKAILNLDEFPVSFQISDKFAFIMMNHGQLRIYDMTNPDTIEEVGVSILFDWSSKMLISNDIAYIGGANGWWAPYAVLKILDVHDPMCPITVDSMNIGQGQITQLAVSDNFLYTTGRWSDPVEGMYGGKWFYVLDISDPSNLLFIDTLCFNVNDFYLSDGLLYLTTENGLEIYNAKNPKNLEKIGNYLLKNANSVCVKDGIIYVSGAGILYTLKVDLPTEIVENSGKVTAFNLKQNYPNPFNPKTVIKYQLPITSTVELGIYNILGQKVATLVSGKQQAGNYQVEWDATNFASGVYMYRMQAGKYSETKKLILLR